MPEKTRLFIANPCHEQWGDMQPNGEGRFCGSCRKTVVDFTMMSDQEVLSWMSGAGRSVCGRFMEGQLNRDLAPGTASKRRRWVMWWQFLLAGWLVSSEVSAQERPSIQPMSQTDARTDNDGKTPIGKVGILQTAGSPGIKFKLVDLSMGSPIAGATININRKTFLSDSAGIFRLPYNIARPGDKIEISSVGYQRKTVEINKSMLGGDQRIIGLSISTTLQGEMVIVKSKKRRIPYDSSLVRTLVNDTMALVGLCKKPFTVYPNSVARGASVTVSLTQPSRGNYVVQLFSTAGLLVESIRIEGVDGPRTELLTIPGTVAAGLYFVRLQHEQTGKVYTQSVEVL